MYNCPTALGPIHEWVADKSEWCFDNLKELADWQKKCPNLPRNRGYGSPPIPFRIWGDGRDDHGPCAFEPQTEDELYAENAVGKLEDEGGLVVDEWKIDDGILYLTFRPQWGEEKLLTLVTEEFTEAVDDGLIVPIWGPGEKCSS